MSQSNQISIQITKIWFGHRLLESSLLKKSLRLSVHLYENLGLMFLSKNKNILCVYYCY